MTTALSRIENQITFCREASYWKDYTTKKTVIMYVERKKFLDYICGQLRAVWNYYTCRAGIEKKPKC